MRQETYTVPSPEAAFAWFYREYRGFVRSVLLKHGRVEEREAEDLVQEVFLVAWRRRVTLTSGEQARSWLCTVAFYVAANHRRQARHCREMLPGELPEPAFHPRVTQAMDAARLPRTAIQKLTKKLAAVLWAYEIEGRSMPQIARALRIRLDTAYARLRFARIRLANARARARARASASAPRLRFGFRGPLHRRLSATRTVRSTQSAGRLSYIMASRCLKARAWGRRTRR
ncbi:RNA polymerase sigma factor [Polyangium jinanense]|uniref:RNA polymerase sigma factor n=1 Tax=Polyangium jinanense TaxID=2829994 RepID=A0A9X3WVP2_9BACT|nr:sigma-70 family RNA polymerase sigma factor [Polyangium jinanense]MDC3960381.1 sigma-70 family RNA polymerase sigma factor [Polyangium jinanense]MDC3979002.1 sigma-70 family RNA polymerase sigma factor [Polyangium jinanense]